MRDYSPVRAPTTVGSAPVKNGSDIAVITRVVHVTPDQLHTLVTGFPLLSHCHEYAL